MLPKSLPKIRKQVTRKSHRSKNKSAGSLHEKSRDAHRLHRAAARQDRVAQLHGSRVKAQEPLVERVAFFRDAALMTLDTVGAEDDGGLSAEQVHQLVTAYLARHDGELSQLAQSRRAGRPPDRREIQLTQLKAKEEGEYTSGLWIPDLRDQENLANLKVWQGEWSALGTVGFVRVSKEGECRASGFPPRGDR